MTKEERLEQIRARHKAQEAGGVSRLAWSIVIDLARRAAFGVGAFMIGVSLGEIMGGFMIK